MGGEQGKKEKERNLFLKDQKENVNSIKWKEGEGRQYP